MQQPTAPTPKQMKNIDDFFDQFEDDESKDEINDEGMLRLCKALEIEPDDVVMLVLSWYMKAATMCTFTRKEFELGCSRLKVWNLQGLKEKMGVLRKQLEGNDAVFSSVYSYAFDFGKERDQRSMNVDVALALWELILPVTKFELLPNWIDFIKSRQEKTRSISRDVWKQLFEFAKQIKPDLTNFDENGAWPVLIDEFVATLKS